MGGSISGTFPQFDHGGLSGLSDDDHTQYSLLAGRSGGQTIIGGTSAGNDLILRSSSNATKGKTLVDETTQSSSEITGAFVVYGGVGISKNLNIGETVNIGGITTLSNTTDTSGYLSGALIVSGGVGIAKKLSIAGETKIVDTTQSTNYATGALVVYGGVGITKNVYINGSLSVAGYSQNPIKARHYWRNTNSGASMTSGTYYPDTNGYVLTTEVGDLIEAFFNITCYLSTTGIARYIEAEIFVDDAIKCNGIDEIADTATGSDDFGNACCHLYWIATGTSHTIKYKFSSQATCKSFNGGINVGLIHYKGSTNVSVVEASI